MVNKKSQQKRNDKNKFKKPLCFGSDSEDEEMLNTNNRHRFRLFHSPPRDESNENNEMNSYFTDDEKEHDSNNNSYANEEYNEYDNNNGIGSGEQYQIMDNDDECNSNLDQDLNFNEEETAENEDEYPNESFSENYCEQYSNINAAEEQISYENNNLLENPDTTVGSKKKKQNTNKGIGQESGRMINGIQYRKVPLRYTIPPIALDVSALNTEFGVVRILQFNLN